MNDNNRELFESWIASPPFERDALRYGDNTAWPGSYVDLDIDLAWHAWNDGQKDLRADLARVIEERDAAIRECAEWASKAGAAEGRAHAMNMQRKEAEQERDKLREDAARLDWVLDNIWRKGFDNYAITERSDIDKARKE